MGLFKQPEYRRFNLKPRYWDPEAEARKETYPCRTGAR